MDDGSITLEETILRLANEWMRACQARDWALLEQMVAPEFTMTANLEWWTAPRGCATPPSG